VAGEHRNHPSSIAHERIIVSSVLNLLTAFREWGWFAGIKTASPPVVRSFALHQKRQGVERGRLLTY
jgi:hypothetical protein